MCVELHERERIICNPITWILNRSGLDTFQLNFFLFSFSLSTLFFSLSAVCIGNPDAKRLYDDLLSNYNKLVRPVVNVTDALTVRIKLKLSQLIDVVSILGRRQEAMMLRCERESERVNSTTRREGRLLRRKNQLSRSFPSSCDRC